MSEPRGAERAPWEHRPWCAVECGFPVGVVEGTHLGRAWTLWPCEPGSGRVQVRLVEQMNETEAGLVRVLLSVTERRLPDDLNPLAAPGGAAGGGGLADISASAGLTAREAAWLGERLVVYAARCGADL